MLSIHIGHHFFGAGNIGDDFMLAGFLRCLRRRIDRLHFSCCSPHDLHSQRRRFPAIQWLPYTLETRREAIAGADAWLGLGGSPFQSDDGDWFIDHLLQEQSLCRELRLPMWYLGVGINDQAALQRAEVRRLIEGAERIWTRDAPSARLLAAFTTDPSKVTPAADLAHCFLSDHASFAARSGVAMCINLARDPLRYAGDIERWVRELPMERLSWLVQEIRELPGAERRIFSALSPDTRQRLTECLPDYSAPTARDLASAWPRAAAVITSRYHAALTQAWAGAAIGILAINDKLRGAAEDLSLPCFDRPSDIVFPPALKRLKPVPRRLLKRRAHQARTAVEQWLAAAAAHPRVRQRCGARRAGWAELRRTRRRQTRRIAMISADSLGDLVLRQPMCRGLLDAGYQISVAARPNCVELAPYIDPRLDVIPIELDPYRRGEEPAYSQTLVRLVGAIESGGFHAILCPSFDRTIVDEAALLRLPGLLRVGFAPGRAAPAWAGDVFRLLGWKASDASLFSAAIPAAREWREIDKYARLMDQAFNIRIAGRRPALEVPAAAYRSARLILVDLGLRPGRYAVCCPTGAANVRIKGVSEAACIEAARRLAAAGIPALLFTGIESERKQLQQLAEVCRSPGLETRVWIVEAWHVRLLLGLIGQSQLYFGCDTGPMHMAAALNVPVAAVFGGGTYPRFLPAAKRSWVAVNELDCFGCGWDCRYPQPLCLTSLQPEMIGQGLQEFIHPAASRRL